MMEEIKQISGLQRINLVGRERILMEIYRRAEQAEEKTRPVLIYLEGAGGVGKTAILEKVLADIKERDDVTIAEEILDLYYLENQTVRGFCNSMVASFPNHESEFNKYMRLVKEVDEAYGISDFDRATEKWCDAENALAEALKKLMRENSHDKPLWIIVDTAELLNNDLPFQENVLKMGTERVEEWLPAFLPRLRGQPFILLLAGRPIEDGHKKYLEDLDNRGWLVGENITVEPLDEKACEDYLREVASWLGDHNDRDGARKIRAYLSENDLQNLRTETNGEPLYLAMTCDILRVGGSLPIGMYGGKKASGMEELTNSYMSLPSPLHRTLQAMALLRKGTDAKLLSRITSVDEQTSFRNLRLARNLTLVKERPGENKRRYFLHDEVYRLYAKQLMKDELFREETFAKVKEYYEDECQKVWIKMEKEPNNLVEFQAKYRRDLVEKMHYAFYFEPWKGFEEYLGQSIEAVGQKILDWKNLLDVEWKRTQNILEGEERYPQKLPEYMEWDAKIKAIDYASTWRLDLSGDKLSELKKLGEAPPIYQLYGWLVRALLAFRNQDSEKVLDDSFDSCINNALELEGALDFSPKISKATMILKAYVDNYDGFRKRKQGCYQQALGAYHRAAATMRREKLGGLSTVLINQAYAMSMLGYDRRARETASEAYFLALKNGSPSYQARAQNVRALVETSAGSPDLGEKYALEALEILQNYPNERIKALVYISLARANRYKWNQTFQHQLTNVEQRGKASLGRALAYLEGTSFVKSAEDGLGWNMLDLPDIKSGAIDLLSQTTDKENWVTALNECGSVWREIAWLTRERGDENPAKKLALRKTKKRLEMAAGIQSVAYHNWEKNVKRRVAEIGGSYYWPILALVNLGWHYLYLKKYPYDQQEDNSQIDNVCEFVAKTIPTQYVIKPWTDDGECRECDDVLIWAVLGKMEMLRGYNIWRTWRKDENALEQTVHHIYLAMEYNYKIGSSSYNNRRAEMGLETRIRRSYNWETELLPRFFAAEEIVRKKIVGDRKPIRRAHVLKWLEERYGPASLWKAGR